MKRLALYLLAVLTFSTALWNEYAFDDVIQVQQNELIRDLHNAIQYFWHPVYPGDLFRPVTMLSYWMSYAISAGDPLVDHLVNLLLYGAVVVLAYALIRRIASEGIALASAAIFAVHPIHTEVVASIVGRAELLSAIGVLGGLLYFTDRSISRYTAHFLGAVFFALGLFSKESSAVLIPLIPFTFYIQQKSGEHWSSDTKKRFFSSLIISTGIFGMYLHLRAGALGPEYLSASQAWFVDNPLVTAFPLERVLKAASLLGRYVFLCFFPHPLSADYSFRVLMPTFDLLSVDGLYLNLIILCIAYALIKKSRVVFFGVCWFFLSFLLTSNIFFAVGTVFGERLAFLPSLGVIVATVSCFSEMYAVTARRAVGVVLVLFGTQSFLQAELWRNNDTLWSYQIQISPESVKTLQNYASALLARGEYDDALVYANRAYEMYPEYDQVSLIKGLIYTYKKRKEDAIFWFNRTLEITPDHLGALNSLGQLYFNTDDKKRALEYFEKALSIESFNFDALLGKAAVLVQEGDRTEGRKLLEGLQRREPGNRLIQQLLALK